jgi:hypothetical protein
MQGRAEWVAYPASNVALLIKHEPVRTRLAPIIDISVFHDWKFIIRPINRPLKALTIVHWLGIL